MSKAKEFIEKLDNVATELLKKYGLDRNVDKTEYFAGDGSSFSAVNQAQKKAKELGYAIGSMDSDYPIGLADSTKYSYIAKWSKTNHEDRAKLGGVLLSKDFRDGEVFLVVFK